MELRLTGDLAAGLLAEHAEQNGSTKIEPVLLGVLAKPKSSILAHAPTKRTHRYLSSTYDTGRRK